MTVYFIYINRILERDAYWVYPYPVDDPQFCLNIGPASNTIDPTVKDQVCEIKNFS